MLGRAVEKVAVRKKEEREEENSPRRTEASTLLILISLTLSHQCPPRERENTTKRSTPHGCPSFRGELLRFGKDMRG
jgi:hypothetical protein